mmetsp:Transcript_37089/g.85688  ORF Transcript_37089/g.85688 Transcript_37089/m.85688 type:complete len:795 (-) Transcript_37089:454-2838(-)
MSSSGSGMSNSDLAAKAESHYNAGDYGQALDALHRIESTIADKQDPRLLHNLRLVESAVAGFNDVEGLKDGLMAIKQQLREKLERDSPESADGDMDLDLAALDSDTSILLYNLAALHFQRKEYTAAQSILENLFAHIEPIDETVAVHVCFLLLDVLLHMARGTLLTERERAAFSHKTEQILSHMEKVQIIGASSSTDNSDDANSGGSGGGAAAAGNGEKDEKVLGGRKGDNPEQVEFEFRLHLYRAKLLLLQQQLKLSKKEIKSALEIYQRDLRPDAATNGFEAGLDDDSRTGMRNMTALYLKANFEYLRQNYRKALKLLASCHSADDGAAAAAAAGGAQTPQRPAVGPLGSMYYNNIACAHHKMRRYHVALHYFQKALTLADQASQSAEHRGLESDGRLLTGFECEIRYNLALQLLLTGRPLEAFGRFEEAAQLFYSRPQLWLRMAECCIQHHSRLQKEGSGAGSEGAGMNGFASVSSGGTNTSVAANGMVTTSVGSGAQRRLLLPCSSHVLDAVEGGGEGGGVGGGPETLNGQCNLHYASKCLHNAVFLCTAAALASKEGRKEEKPTFSAPPSKSKDKQGDKGGSKPEGAAAAEGGEAAVSGIERVVAADDSAVLQAALLDLAYVHLSLSDPVLALSYALKLLNLPSLPEGSPRRFIGHMYAAEALCLLSKPADALEYVAPGGQPLSEEVAARAGEQLAEEAVPLHAGTGGQAEGQGGSSSIATAALHVNIATVYALQGNLQQAEKATRAALGVCPWSWDATRMLVYILLRTGSTNEALDVLKLSRLSSISQ